MDDRAKIQEILELKRETSDAWLDWHKEAEEDYQFVLGDQWSDSDKEKLINEKRPILSLNSIKKPIDLISGFQRQNKTDIIVLPIEKSDQAMADTLSEILMWVMVEGKGNDTVATSFYDALSIGLGWIHPIMRFNKDMESGDIELNSENPFRMLPDCEMTKKDLSDANYIFRHAWISKFRAKEEYKEHAGAIDKLSGGDYTQFRVQQPTTRVRKNVQMVNVLEYWYRKMVPKRYLADVATGDVMEWTGDDKILKDIEKLIKTQPEAMFKDTGVPFGRLEVVRVKKSAIFLTTMIEEEIVAYDGVSPYQTDMFPFIPIFGYYTPNFNDWVWKLQGVTRSLKDSQREKNKRRSKMLHSSMTMPYALWLYKEGSVNNPEDFKRAAETGMAIKWHGDTPPTQSPPQQLSPALVELESMHSNDMREIGPNADLLGMSGQQGGSGQSAPGITLQLRQRQGLTSIQNLFDNLSYAKELLGQYMIQLIFNHFSEKKIMQILNHEVPQGFFESKGEARYNCKVDEVANSATYKAYNFTLLAGFAEKGLITPDILMEFSDIPQDVKDKIAEQSQAQAQAAEEEKKMTHEMAMRELQLKEKEVEIKYLEMQIKAFEAGLKLDKAGLERESLDIQKLQAGQELAGLMNPETEIAKMDEMPGLQQAQQLPTAAEAQGIPPELQQPQPIV